MTSIAQTAVRAMPKWMSLFEYMLTLMAPAEAAQLREAVNKGYDLGALFHTNPDIVAAIQAYRDACTRYSSIILSELAAGTLIAQGFGTDDPLYYEPNRIHVYWWRGSVELDIFRSSADIDRRRFLRITVCRRLDEVLVSRPSFDLKLLRVTFIRAEKRVLFDDYEVAIPATPYEFLLMLAEARKHGSFVLGTTIEEKFNREARDLAREVRDRLDTALGELNLVRTERSPLRYWFDVSNERIFII